MEAHNGPAAGVVEAGALELRSERDGAVQVLALHGELDLSSVSAFDRELARAEASDAQRILVDLRKLDFIDATGISALVRAHRRQAAESGDRLGLHQPSGQPRRVIELTGIDELLPFVE
jgi:anti-sigma B factor antagonist